MRLVYRRVRSHPSGESWSLLAVVRVDVQHLPALSDRRLFTLARVAPVRADVEPGQAFAFDPSWGEVRPSSVPGCVLVSVRQRGGYDV